MHCARLTYFTKNPSQFFLIKSCKNHPFMSLGKYICQYFAKLKNDLNLYIEINIEIGFSYGDI